MESNNCFGVIYKVTNKINGKLYIGQTTQGLYKRRWSHESRSLKCSDNMPFHKSINKYGKHNFRWEVIERCESKDEMDEMEFHYIISFKTNSCNGYNCTVGGEGNCGYKHSKSVCDKISSLKLGTKLSKESIEKRSEKQSYRWKIIYPDGTEQNILNLSKFCRDNLLNPGSMNSVSRGDREHHKGYKCVKLSKRARPLSKKTKEAISKANVGKKLTKECIAKRTEAQSGIWEIIDSAGNTSIIRNLKRYCRNNDIRYSCMTRVSLGYRKHHKGYKCRKLKKYW